MNTATLTPPTITTPAHERLLTAADLAALPTSLPSGDVRYELNDGRLVIMPPPGYEHSRRQAKVVQYLGTDAEERGLGVVCGEVGIVLRRNPDRVVGADGAFVLTASFPVRKTKEGYLETIPEIVIEVRSKNDTDPEEAAKREEYFDAGVRQVWALHPDTRTATIHQRGSPDIDFQNADTFSSTLLPGFSVPVLKLFREVY